MPIADRSEPSGEHRHRFPLTTVPRTFRQIGATQLSASLNPTKGSGSGLYRLTLVSQPPRCSRIRLLNLEGHRKRRCRKPGRRFRWISSLPRWVNPRKRLSHFSDSQSANGGPPPGSVGNPCQMCFPVLYNGRTHGPEPWRPLHRYPPDGDR